MVQWLALLCHTKQFPGLRFQPFSVDILSVPVWVSSSYPPQPKDVFVGLTGDSKLAMDVR